VGIISLVIVGLLIGGLGRLILRGAEPRRASATLAAGVAGAILGATISGFLGWWASSVSCPSWPSQSDLLSPARARRPQPGAHPHGRS